MEELEEGGLEEFVPGFATDAGGGREEHEQRRAAQEDEAPSGGRRGAGRRSEEGEVPGGGSPVGRRVRCRARREDERGVACCRRVVRRSDSSGRGSGDGRVVRAWAVLGC